MNQNWKIHCKHNVHKFVIWPVILTHYGHHALIIHFCEILFKFLNLSGCLMCYNCSKKLPTYALWTFNCLQNLIGFVSSNLRKSYRKNQSLTSLRIGESGCSMSFGQTEGTSSATEATCTLEESHPLVNYIGIN